MMAKRNPEIGIDLRREDVVAIFNTCSTVLKGCRKGGIVEIAEAVREVRLVETGWEDHAVIKAGFPVLGGLGTVGSVCGRG